MCANFHLKLITLTFGPKFAQKWLLGSNFQKSKSEFGISILVIPCTPIFGQNGQLWIFGPKFVQKSILGSEFQKSTSRFGINTSNIPFVPIFSQNGRPLIFRPKFGEIAILRAIFWFQILLRVLQRAEWRLKWAWWRWMVLGGGWNELGRGGWWWVHG